ncbi:MAG: hypothetical protein OEL57_14925 [Trichlorobacter sp.]|uniref:hypothetical protein n=1 Tax=Trichlorobacter sp. TaxID=2911007 RepID=UPI002564044E|nr:hypothetical protein [Trichlorobacter sp.]MDK9719177.1 hypothetical protein [Trichlorobacter sp.]
MSDLRTYIDNRKKRDPDFSGNYDNGFQDFMVGDVQSALAEADNSETVFVSHDAMREWWDVKKQLLAEHSRKRTESLKAYSIGCHSIIGNI